MTTESKLSNLESLIEECVQGRSSDVDQLLKRKGPYNQVFTPLIAAWSELAVCQFSVDTALRLLRDESLDEATALRLAEASVGRRLKTLEVRYGMAECVGAIRGTLDVMSTERNVASAREAVEALRDYLHFIHHLIRTRVPWHELSVAYEGAVVVKKAWSDWLNDDAMKPGSPGGRPASGVEAAKDPGGGSRA